MSSLGVTGFPQPPPRGGQFALLLVSEPCGASSIVLKVTEHGMRRSWAQSCAMGTGSRSRQGRGWGRPEATPGF